MIDKVVRVLSGLAGVAVGLIALYGNLTFVVSVLDEPEPPQLSWGLVVGCLPVLVLDAFLALLIYLLLRLAFKGSMFPHRPGLRP